MKIITLVDNVCNDKSLKGCYGLSFYIETSSHKLLFDFGIEDLLIHNANVLGIDLSDVDIAVLSHGHSDHADGIKSFMSVNEKAKIYINKNAFREYYASTGEDYREYIGLDKDLEKFDRVVLVDDYLKIDEEVQIFSRVNGDKCLPSANSTLKVILDGQLVQDEFDHEQNIIITDDNKKVMLAGCAHNGIINIIEAGEKLIGADFDLVIAGFHLYNPVYKKSESIELMREIANELKKRDTRYVTCHCTGLDAYESLKQFLGDKISYGDTGRQIL